MRSVVVLRGYGNFGRRIVEALATDTHHRVLITGTSCQQAKQLAQEIGGNTEPFVLDEILEVGRGLEIAVVED